MQLTRRMNSTPVGLKLAAGFIVMVALTVVTAVSGGLALQGYAKRSLIVADASSIESSLLDARTDEKNFQIRRDAQYIDHARDLADNAIDKARHLREAIVIASDDAVVNEIVDSTRAYRTLLDKYEANIDDSADIVEGIESELVTVARRAVDNARGLQETLLERMDADFQKAMMTLVLTAIGAVVIAIILGWVLSQNIIRPIRRTVDIANKVASGDLTVDARSDRSDEFGQLLAAFATMVTNLRALISDIGTGANSIAASSEELSTVTNQTSAAVTSQRDKTDQVATAMNEMVATVSEVAKSAESAFDAANTANERSTEGGKSVAETRQYVGELKQQIDDVMQQLLGLQSETRNIGSILDVIKAVAEQTNLLALNAAIEAARAGEHGRGFAVVADEVRSLAQRTQSSAGEIESLINNLVASAENSSASMERSTVLAGQTLDSAEATQEKIKEVVRSVDEIRQYNSQIATAAEQQASVAEDINKNVTDIREEGEQTASATEQVSASSAELARLGDDLNGQVARFRI